MRLRRREHFSRNYRSWDLTLLNRPDRLTCKTVEGIQPALLGRLNERWDCLPVYSEIHKYRSRRCVEVPDFMMDELEVPRTFTCTSVQRNNARSVEVISRAKATVVINGRAVSRNIYKVIIRISRERRPRRHISGPFPGVIFPRFVTVFSGLGNDIELPLEIAGAKVISEDVAGHIFYARLVVALFRGVTHNNGVIDHDRWR